MRKIHREEETPDEKIGVQKKKKWHFQIDNGAYNLYALYDFLFEC